MKPLRSFWRVFWSDRRAAAAAVFLLAEILLVLLLPLKFGIDGIMYAGPVADFTACVISVILIRREMKKIRQLEAAQQ